MKLKDGVIITKNGEEFILVAAGEAGEAFTGMIRLNKTGVFIAEQMLKDTSAEAVVAALLDKYDVTEEVARESLNAMLEKFESVGLMEK